MISYKHTIFGIFLLFFICVIYNIIVDRTNDVSTLYFMSILFIVWLVVCAIYCFRNYPNYFKKGSVLSETYVAILNGLFAGPVGLLFDYNMNNQIKGYSCYMYGIILICFAVGNTAKLIGLS